MHPSTYYYSHTKIPIPKVDWESVWNDTVPTGYPKWKPMDIPADAWSTEITDKFKAINLRPSLLRVFKWKQNAVYPWHIDGDNLHVSKFALNWIVGGDGRIQWDDTLVLPTDKTGITAGLLRGGPKDHYTCQSADSGNGCLLKIDIPHRVTTIGDTEPRHTLSLLFAKADNRTYNEIRQLMIGVGLI